MNEQRNERQSLDCAVAQDLLPLYNDGVVSTVTGQAIRRHLEHCKTCRREYEELREILPVPQEDFATTKERFLALERKLERRRIFRILWIVLAVVALFAVGWNLLTHTQLRPVDKVVDQVVRSYRYEDHRGTHFLILYHGGLERFGSEAGARTKVTQEGNVCRVQEEWKTNILGTRSENTIGWYTDICLEENGITDAAAVDTLIYQGKVVWTEEANGDDPLPDYVPLYFEFREGDYTGSPEARGELEIEVDEGYVQAAFQDGKLILWNLDGVLLYEGYPSQETAEPSVPGQ